MTVYGVKLMSQKQLGRQSASVILEEFKALVKNLVPATLEQAEWICGEVERLTRKHPELKEKLEEWCKMPESEEKELCELIDRILAEAEENEGKRKAWLNEKLKEARMKRQYLKAHHDCAKHDRFEKPGEGSA